MVTDFIFDGQSLSGFGYMLSSFNGVNDENIEVSTLEYTDIKSPLSDVSHKVATSYPNNYTKTIQISKSMCANNEDFILTNDDVSTLTKWLCRKEYKLFKWVDDDDDDEIFYEVHCKVSKVLVFGICYGLEITIESNRPFGITREINYIRELQANEDFEVTVYSDEEGYIYPNIEITLRQAGNLTITNQIENRNTVIKNCINNEVLTIKGSDILQITSNNPNHFLATDFNYKFPRLYNEYRNTVNTLSSNLPCSIKISYHGIRKVGL